MSSEDKMYKDLTDVELNSIGGPDEQELSILVTDADKYGSDITEMSNFFGDYVHQLSLKVSTKSMTEVVINIPVADLGIINDVVHHTEVIMKGTYGYIPDFDDLPHDIKVKFDKGLYKLGESRQVDGNMRAVILDENGIRVKDITLKRVRNNSGALETTQSIINQAQLRQIYEKLDIIQELQSYQIDRDRDRDIVTPFLNARGYILLAQTNEKPEDKYEILKKSINELTKALNAVYTDMSTVSKHLVKLTNWPIFQRRNQIQIYIEFLAQDLQLATMYVGVLLHVFDYLGDKASSTLAFERYQYVMRDFFMKSINQKGLSTAQLIHSNYLYNDQNRNFWYEFSREMISLLQADQGLLEGKDIYMVSLEDIDNGNEH